MDILTQHRERHCSATNINNIYESNDMRNMSSLSYKLDTIVLITLSPIAVKIFNETWTTLVNST